MKMWRVEGKICWGQVTKCIAQKVRGRWQTHSYPLTAAYTSDPAVHVLELYTPVR